jgi:hypothetical protein
VGDDVKKATKGMTNSALILRAIIVSNVTAAIMHFNNSLLSLNNVLQ